MGHLILHISPVSVQPFFFLPLISFFFFLFCFVCLSHCLAVVAMDGVGHPVISAAQFVPFIFFAQHSLTDVLMDGVGHPVISAAQFVPFIFFTPYSLTIVPMDGIPCFHAAQLLLLLFSFVVVAACFVHYIF